MNESHTPPAASDAAQAPHASPESPVSPVGGGAARRTWITVAVAVVGGLALAGAGAGAAFAAAGQLRSAAPQAGAAVGGVDVTGVTELTVDADAADLLVRFDDVDEATLDVRGDGRSDWTLRVDGDELIVKSPHRGFGWWVGDWGNWFDGMQTVTLTLPESLRGKLDADLTLAAGSLRAEGDFDELDAQLEAGSMVIEGAVRDLPTSTSAGELRLAVSDVETADLTLSAGRVHGALTGAQPKELDLSVSAGSMTLTLPEGAYAIDQDVAAGDFTNDLGSAQGATSIISVEVSAGDLHLSANR